MAAKDLTITFTKERETKNTVRFQENLEKDRERGTVGTLYVLQKDLEVIGNPEQLKVTISPA